MQTEFFKRDDERQRLYGVALVADQPDRQGDIIADHDLEDAACRAVQKGCVVKIDHAGGAVGRLVASWPLTADIAAALGIERPGGKSVWLVGLQIDDAEVWKQVRSGSLGHALSIGGRGQRRAM